MWGAYLSGEGGGVGRLGPPLPEDAARPRRFGRLPGTGGGTGGDTGALPLPPTGGGGDEGEWPVDGRGVVSGQQVRGGRGFGSGGGPPVAAVGGAGRVGGRDSEVVPFVRGRVGRRGLLPPAPDGPALRHPGEPIGRFRGPAGSCAAPPPAGRRGERGGERSRLGGGVHHVEHAPAAGGEGGGVGRHGDTVRLAEGGRGRGRQWRTVAVGAAGGGAREGLRRRNRPQGGGGAFISQRDLPAMDRK